MTIFPWQSDNKMACKDRAYHCLSLLVLFSVVVISAGQNFWKISQVSDDNNEDIRIKIVWCTTNREEQHKCYNLAMANERDKLSVGYDAFKIECVQTPSKEECMKLIDEEKATVTSLDAGEIFIGGRYNSLVPIAQEAFADGSRDYYAVAALKKGKLGDVQSLQDLRGKRACFAGVQTFAGWILPVYTLMREGGMEITDCNNHVKSATRFFGPSCAVNCLTSKYNPIGDNSDKLCQLCIGRIPGGRCTDADPYAGFEGAFRCLLEVGDIAFLKHTTIPELVAGDEFTSISKDSFELLCKDGTKRPVDDYLHCNWGRVPSNAIVTTSAASAEQRKKLQLFLEKMVQFYGRGLKQNFTRPVEPDYYDSNRRDPNNYDSNRQDPNNYDSNRQDPNYYDTNRQPPNSYDSNRQQDRAEYDQFGNRRTKRQNVPGGNREDKRPPTTNDNEFGQNRLTQYGQADANQDDGAYSQNNLPFPFSVSDNTNNNNQDRDRDKNPQQFDPFARDPFTINRDEIGVNIDPYQDANYNSRNPIYAFDNRQATPPPSEPNFNFANVSFYENFNMFESTPRYGSHGNLLFQDATRNFVALNENQQTYESFLGRSMEVIMGVRECQVNKMTLCVTSEMENDKCVKMRTALKSHLLKPELDCYRGHSQINCMQAIRSGLADIAVLDASDVYTGGLNFDLVPFISEVYNLNDPEYYVVAVAKESDPSTELTYLKGKYTCHGGINTAAGWVYPLAFLISNGWIRPYGCNSIRAAAEYFSKSCVPGALSTEYNTGVPYDNMCDLCHGASYKYCRRDASEDYYGHSGAFRCLVEGGGHVAFVKHTTVTENTGGKREEWWARDNLNDDFELLCPDGTRAEINEFEKCNLGKVKANAIVTRGGYGYNETHVNAYINVFLYAQTLFGRKTTDEFSFSMFSSMPPYTDLIFQDATTKLKVIHPTQRHYALYLGNDFMRARRIVDCHAGSSTNNVSVYTLLITTIFTIFVVLR